MLMPKGPQGLPAMGFASLGVGVSWAISCLGLTVLISEWLVVHEKADRRGAGEGVKAEFGVRLDVPWKLGLFSHDPSLGLGISCNSQSYGKNPGISQIYLSSFLQVAPE